MVDLMPTAKVFQSHPTLPIRAAVFNRVKDVDRAIDRLLRFSFRADQLTVVTSEETIKQHFADFQHEQPGGTNAPLGAIAGSTIGAALLGGMTLLTLSLTPGVGLAVAAGWSAGAGGVIGGFVGAMASRGTEKETSEFYAQSLLPGQILLAVECHEQDGDPEANLAVAEQVFEEMHRESVALPEG